MNVLVTGANGFVGKALVYHLCEAGHSVIATSRKQHEGIDCRVDQIRKIELNENSDFGDLLIGVDAVIHLAAQVHIMNDQYNDPIGAFRRVNRDATLNLAIQAAEAGVKRFIFLSTIKVNGEFTTDGRPFSEEDDCQPADSYAISKFEAEKGLKEIASNTKLEVVIIRPPLIYGPGVKGNFAMMMSCIDKEIPLPFGAVKNQRSLLAVDNLVDFIGDCLEHPKAANEVFLLSDGQDVSTVKLLHMLAHSQGKRLRLVSLPVFLMSTAAALLGKKPIADRLFRSLQVDSSKARKLIEWSPVVSMEEQFMKITNFNSQLGER